jgi:hypothetical protein
MNRLIRGIFRRKKNQAVTGTDNKGEKESQMTPRGLRVCFKW